MNEISLKVFWLFFVCGVRTSDCQGTKAPKCATTPHIWKKVDTAIRECQETVKLNIIKDTFYSNGWEDSILDDNDHYLLSDGHPPIIDHSAVYDHKPHTIEHHLNDHHSHLSDHSSHNVDTPIYDHNAHSHDHLSLIYDHLPKIRDQYPKTYNHHSNVQEHISTHNNLQEIHDKYPRFQDEHSQTHDQHPQTHYEHPQSHDQHPQTHYEYPQTHDQHPQTHYEHPQIRDQHTQIHYQHKPIHDEHPQIHSQHPQTHYEHSQIHDQHLQTHYERPQIHDEHSQTHDHYLNVKDHHTPIHDSDDSEHFPTILSYQTLAHRPHEQSSKLHHFHDVHQIEASQLMKSPQAFLQSTQNDSKKKTGRVVREHVEHRSSMSDNPVVQDHYIDFNDFRKKRHVSDHEWIHSSTATYHDKRIAGCILQCIYKKNHAVDAFGWPTLDGLVNFYSEGVNEHGYFMATLRAVDYCLKGSSAKYHVNRRSTPEKGQTCDVAFDVFDCVSDKITEYCSSDHHYD